MGATNFIDKVSAPTVKDAFHHAVEEALHWHGHGGYTGTIAEKPGYIVFDVPLNDLPERHVTREIWDSKNGGFTMTAVRLDPVTRLENAMFFYREHQWKWDADLRKSVNVDPFTVAIEPSVPRWLKDDPEKLAKYQADELASIAVHKADARFFMEKMGRANWEKMIATYESKWDECVAIKTGQDEWTFIGLASC